MSSNNRGTEYNLFVRLVLKLPRPVRVLLILVLVMAMLLFMMLVLKTATSEETKGPDPITTPIVSLVPTNTPETMPTASPTATPTAIPTEDPTMDVTPSPEPTPVVYDPSFVMPNAENRPVAVVIDNKDASAQSVLGLKQAQIVYEMVGDKGISSIMALYWDIPQGLQISGIGSARHYMLNIAAEHQAVIYSNGVSVYAEVEINRDLFGVRVFNAKNDSFGVFSTLDSRVIVNADGIGSHLTGQNIQMTLDQPNMVFKYLEDTAVLNSSKPAYEVLLPYSDNYTSCFTWDPDKHLYLRWRNDIPQVDKETGEQLTAANILVIKMPSNAIEGDSEGMQEINMVGSGIGWFVTEGRALQIVWSKVSREAPLEIKDIVGGDILLNPGQTWVSILPTEAEEGIN